MRPALRNEVLVAKQVKVCYKRVMKSVKLVILCTFAILYAQSVQARPVEKLACRTSGKIQSVQTLIVEPTDLTGQICAISSNASNRLEYFVSNGMIEDAKIFVKSESVAGLESSTIYLIQSQDAIGVKQYRLEKWTVCDPLDIEFCYGKYAEPQLEVVDADLRCEIVKE